MAIRTAEEVKEFLVDKFGSQKSFAYSARFDYDKLLRVLNGDFPSQADLNHIMWLAEETDPFLNDNQITEEDREWIRIAIVKHFKTAVAFCEEVNEKGINSVYISNLISSKNKLKRKTPKYYKLVEILKRYEEKKGSKAPEEPDEATQESQ